MGERAQFLCFFCQISIDQPEQEKRSGNKRKEKERRGREREREREREGGDTSYKAREAPSTEEFPQIGSKSILVAPFWTRFFTPAAVAFLISNNCWGEEKGRGERKRERREGFFFFSR